MKKHAKLILRLKRQFKKQQAKEKAESKLPTLHSQLGNRALDYFGWEFAKGSQKATGLMKNQSILEAVREGTPDFGNNDDDVVQVETRQDSTDPYLY